MMKRSLICAVLMATAAVGGATACEPLDYVVIKGSVWERGHDRAQLMARLAPGESQRFEISGQRSVEIARNKAGRSTVKLRDPQGHALRAASSFACLALEYQRVRLLARQDAKPKPKRPAVQIGRAGT